MDIYKHYIKLSVYIFVHDITIVLPMKNNTILLFG